VEKEIKEYKGNYVEGEEDSHDSDTISNAEEQYNESALPQDDGPREEGDEEDVEDLTQVARMSPFTRLIGELFRKVCLPLPPQYIFYVYKIN